MFFNLFFSLFLNFLKIWHIYVLELYTLLCKIDTYIVLFKNWHIYCVAIDTMGRYGFLRHIMCNFWNIRIYSVWTIISVYDRIWTKWTSLNVYEPLWTSLPVYESLWTSLSVYDGQWTIWTYFNVYERIWKSLYYIANMNIYEHLKAFMIVYELYEHLDRLWTSMNDYKWLST